MLTFANKQWSGTSRQQQELAGYCSMTYKEMLLDQMRLPANLQSQKSLPEQVTQIQLNILFNNKSQN